MPILLSESAGLRDDAMAREGELSYRGDEKGCAREPVQLELLAGRGAACSNCAIDDTSHVREKDAVVPMTGGLELLAYKAVHAPAPAPSSLGSSYRPESGQVDLALCAPVIASREEILQARQLRLELRSKYLNRPSQACSLWCVGVD